MVRNPSRSDSPRTLFGLVRVAVALVLVGAYACQQEHDRAGGEEDVIRLRYSSPSLPSEPPNIQASHCLDLVEEKTNGRVTIERFMGGSLGGPLEHLSLVSSGAVDIIPLHVDQFPQQLPLHKVLNTEQFVPAEQALANITALTREIPETRTILDAEQQRNHIKVLWWHDQGPTGITAGFPARSLDDLRGKKVNVITGFQRKVFDDLGILPVNVQVPELYESLSRGVIDAIFMATAAVVPLKWYEVGKTHLVLGRNCVSSQPVTLNLETWHRLPPDVQQAFLDASEETARWAISQTRALLARTMAAFREAGVDVVELPPGESKRFLEVLTRYATQDWLDNAKAQGVGDEAALLQTYWDAMKWGKWTGPKGTDR